MARYADPYKKISKLIDKSDKYGHLASHHFALLLNEIKNLTENQKAPKTIKKRKKKK